MGNVKRKAAMPAGAGSGAPICPKAFPRRSPYFLRCTALQNSLSRICRSGPISFPQYRQATRAFPLGIYQYYGDYNVRFCRIYRIPQRGFTIPSGNYLRSFPDTTKHCPDRVHWSGEGRDPIGGNEFERIRSTSATYRGGYLELANGLRPTNPHGRKIGCLRRRILRSAYEFRAVEPMDRFYRRTRAAA